MDGSRIIERIGENVGGVGIGLLQVKLKTKSRQLAAENAFTRGANDHCAIIRIKKRPPPRLDILRGRAAEDCERDAEDAFIIKSRGIDLRRRRRAGYRIKNVLVVD